MKLFELLVKINQFTIITGTASNILHTKQCFVTQPSDFLFSRKH